ncbi:MAG: hypothetical protein QME51_00540 [Planctomycetota bacterium]|nr:hypothetical protein [Planctomycetota bacterium]MDI6786847.1 hypothetical protein [Planctomycetota bacterium]
MAKIQYDSKIIYEFAERLYDKAGSVVATYTIIGIILGGGGGALVGTTFRGGEGTIVAAIIGMVILGIIGYSIGSEKAFWIKSQAQQALCQVQIEQNIYLILHSISKISKQSEKSEQYNEKKMEDNL